MAKSTAIKSGFDWQQKFSDLYSTSLGLGTEYARGRISEQVGASRADTAQRAMQAEVGLSGAKMKMYAFLAVAAVAAFVVYKMIRKSI